MVVFADLEEVDDAPDIRSLVHGVPHMALSAGNEESESNRPNPNVDNGFAAALSCYP